MALLKKRVFIMALTILKKLAVSKLFVSPSKMVSAEITTPVFLYRILGQARKATIGTSNFGDYFEFSGEFRATDALGNEYAAPKAFLQSPVDEMLYAELEASKGQPVEFGFDVFVSFDPKEGSRGYMYSVQTLKEVAPSDPLAALTASVKPLVLPKVEAATLAAPAAAIAKAEAKPEVKAAK